MLKFCFDIQIHGSRRIPSSWNSRMVRSLPGVVRWFNFIRTKFLSLNAVGYIKLFNNGPRSPGVVASTRKPPITNIRGNILLRWNDDLCNFSGCMHWNFLLQ